MTTTRHLLSVTAKPSWMTWHEEPAFSEGDIVQWNGGKQTMMVLTVDREHGIYYLELLMTHDGQHIGDTIKYSFFMARENLTKVG